MGILTLNEQIFLTAILMLEDGAYGVAIRDEISRLSGKRIVYGTLYNTLDKLARKGFVVAEKGEPTKERGGRSKIFYRLTRLGLSSLEESRDLQMALWKAVPGSGIGGKK